MISCSLDRRDGELTGLANIVMEYINGGEVPKIAVTPINAKNLRDHIIQCELVLGKIERIKRKT